MHNKKPRIARKGVGRSSAAFLSGESSEMEGSKVVHSTPSFNETVEFLRLGEEASGNSFSSLIGDAAPSGTSTGSGATDITNLNIPPPISIFGDTSPPSSSGRVIVQGFSVIIGFFTQDLQESLSEVIDTPQLLLILFLLFIVWKISSDKFLEWFTTAEKPNSLKTIIYQLEWRDDVVNWIYFVSYVIVYLLFGYLSRLIFTTASDFGFTFTELILLTILAMPFMYDVYRKAYIDILSHS